MADSTEEHVWTNHARELFELGLKKHDILADTPLRVKLLSLKDEVKNVADFGCGPALWYNLFEGFQYIGIDQNAEMLKCAKLLCPDGTFIHTPAEATGLEGGSVDLVFTAAVLQHNRAVRKAAVVTEVVRVLRPHGYLLCTECTFRPDNYGHVFKNVPFSDDLSDGYSYTAVGWEKYMAGHGLTLLWHEDPSEYLFRKKA